MRITVVGGGPLGRFFALHLAWAGADVSLLIRDRDAAGSQLVRSRAMPFGRERQTPLRMVSALSDVDAVIVAVRAEQLYSTLTQVSATSAKVVLVFTPMLNNEHGELRARVPTARAAMPALAAEMHEGVLRYWQAPSTLVEVREESQDVYLNELVRLLRRGGVWVRTLPDVATRSSATTTAFFPLHLAIHACPRLRQWRRQPELVSDLASAMQRSRRLARRMGKVEPGVAALAWWMSTPWRIRWAAVLMPRMAPALTHFLEQHFAAKLGLQHVKLAHEIDEIAQRLGQASPIPSSLMRSLPRVASETPSEAQETQ